MTTAALTLAPGAHPDARTPSATLIAQIAAGGEAAQQAMAEVYDRYVDTVFRFIYFRVGNRPLAEDLTSDVFLRIMVRAKGWREMGRDLGAWIITIARNRVADHFKSGRYRLEVTAADVTSTGTERSKVWEIPAAETDALNNLAHGKVRQALLMLNPEQQACLMWRFYYGFTHAETARQMGKSEAAIKALHFRAVRSLARRLEDLGQLQDVMA